MEDLKGLKLCLKANDNGEDNCSFNVGGLRIGEGLLMISGPCSIESEEQALRIAIGLKKTGVNMLRGGAFKARTSPYDFQGLGLDGLKIIEKMKKETGLPVVTEVIDTRDIDTVAKYADVLQIGSRNMQNFSLLKEVGRSGFPVLLKRGMSSTLNEWLNCAEYILTEGNKNIILCERGIRTFETFTRNTVDISAVPAIKNISHLPVIVDPSHGTGRPDLIESVSMAAIAAGADGLMIEVHYNPKTAVSDGFQALEPERYDKVFRKVKSLYRMINKADFPNE